MKRILVILFFSLLLVALGFEIYSLENKRREYTAQINDLSAEANVLSAENHQLERDVQFYSDDANLIKQLREKFNYRFPDEEMLIIVEPQE